jgi:hypothetical protein
MTTEATAAYGQRTAITSALTSAFTPILNAGINQEGYSAGEKTALNTQAEEGVAGAYQQASAALGSKLGAEGGGNQYLPSGANAEMQQDTALGAASTLASEKNQITQADYAQGQQNYEFAANELGSTAGLIDATGLAGAANSAGADASTTAHNVSEESSSWLNTAVGALGSVASKASYSSTGAWSI